MYFPNVVKTNMTFRRGGGISCNKLVRSSRKVTFIFDIFRSLHRYYLEIVGVFVN